MADGAGDSVAFLLQQSPTTPPDGWTRCHMYVKHKKRFCRQQVVKGSCYCGNHRHNHDMEQRKRVPCPIDPTHLVYEDMIEKHVKVCPRITRKQSQEEHAYYQHNVNVGGYGTTTTTTTTTRGSGALLHGTKDRPTTMLCCAHTLALSILNVYQRVFSNNPLPRDSLRHLTLQTIVEAIPELDLSDFEMQSGLAESIQQYRIKSGGTRHLWQQASLVGHLRRIGLMDGDDDNLTLLEMGAGRGMLGLIAAGVVAASSSPSSSLLTDPHKQVQLCLVERSGSRSKADTVLRTTNSQTKYMNLERVQWSRIQCDLSHVHIPTVLSNLYRNDEKKQSGIRKRKQHHCGEKLVVIAKHLCGAGTDLALQSLREVHNLDACIMATCCHGVCSWENYVGRDFLRDLFGTGDDALDFGPIHFELMRRWSSGTVAPECSCGNNAMTDSIVESTTTTTSNMRMDQDEQHGNVVAMEDAKDPMNVSSICKSLGLNCGPQGLGRACQRLLDQGRCDYLRRVLFRDTDNEACRIEMFHYVPPTVTPQNAVLIAHRIAKHSN